MRVSDIITEVAEVCGKCPDNAILYTTITRAVQLLANKKLVDPLLAYYDFSTQDSYFVALPRDCKTVLKVNINQSPAITRSRLFEFALNTDGTQDGAEAGVAWSDRGYSPIQDERQLPGVLAYKCSNSADNGKQCLVWGLDENGREIQQALTADSANPVAGTLAFHKITRIARDETQYECFLWCNGTNVAGQYYGNETEPNYRVIKLSANPAAVRVIYRRQVYAVATLDDFIPMTSELAVIYAAKAVRFMAMNEEEKAGIALTFAVQCLTEEQASRDEHTTLAEQTEIPGATNTPINVRDGIVVGDVYDEACAIHGPISRAQILDKITTAVEVLSQRGQWDSRLAVVDVYTVDNTDTVNYTQSNGSGLFVLPRYVETPVQINICHRPILPRNRWFEFHLNALGERDLAPHGSWDDMGEVCLSRPLPLDGATDWKSRQTIPTKLIAVPDTLNDDDTEVRIFGMERLADGRDVEVWRNGVLGWLCPCEFGNFNPGDDAPSFTRVDRITKGASQGFIKLYGVVRTEATSSDVTALTNGVAATPAIPWASAGQNTVFYGTSVGHSSQYLEVFIYSDAARTVQVFHIQFDGGESDTILQGGNNITPTVDFPFNGMLSGWAATPAGDSDFTLTRTFSSTGVSYSPGVEYGYWYPDELEPKYRMIRVPTKKAQRIRVMYRKRTGKFTSLLEPIPLRSRLAIIAQLRALKVQETDPVLMREHEANALRYLRDERINLGPTETGALQVDDSGLPSCHGGVN